ncbi:endolytic transglycosylase MltG [bacterium]|nr:endolytic transglycosylase MltG [bacterium]MBU1985146.1 endolytic transglycosylase MltG [bacterium]
MDRRARARTLRGLVVVAFALSILLALEVFSRFLLEGSSLEGPRRMVEVTIPQGAGVAQIASILHEQELIEYPVLFRYAVRIMGADTRIQAGRVSLASGQSLIELIRNLTRAKAVGKSVTIVEGSTATEIAGKLREVLSVDSAAFMAAVNDGQFVHDLGLEGTSLEGYLFPDTYYIAVDTEPRRIASRMVANFRNRMPGDLPERLARSSLSLHGMITLASIIEWETMLQGEARIISSVYHNRLRRGMLLQADPTVAYALGRRPSRLYYSDLRVDSPYNTYRYEGLPPGPINNPGLASINAALNPQTTGYLYFVANGDGTHTFTSTLDEHLTAKRRLDALRRQIANSEMDSTNGTD